MFVFTRSEHSFKGQIQKGTMDAAPPLPPRRSNLFHFKVVFGEILAKQ